MLFSSKTHSLTHDEISEVITIYVTICEIHLLIEESNDSVYMEPSTSVQLGSLTALGQSTGRRMRCSNGTKYPSFLTRLYRAR